MSYVSFYRKYRPLDFNGIIGQDHIVATLKNQIKTGKVSHAYLFTGTRGTGKTSIAKIFARAVNCTNSADGNPCLQCDSCKLTLAANCMDIIEMDAASNNGVDYARDIREKVQYPPSNLRYKVYIIDEVHMLSTGAFNALLKTLEEPPAHAVFILCTTEAHKIPQTILSRCMRFDFKLVGVEALSKNISEIFDKEGKIYTKEAVNAIAVAAEGSVRDAQSIADRCFSLTEGKLTYDDVMNVLGVSSKSSIAAIADSVIGGNASEVLLSVNKLVTAGKDIARLNKDLALYFRDVLVAKTVAGANSILCLPSDLFASLEAAAEKATTAKLLYIIDTLARTEQDLRFSLSPQLLFEAVLLRLISASGEVDVDGLDKRIAALEKASARANIIIDKTSYKSVWLGLKQHIADMNKPLLLGLWQEVEGKLVDNAVVLSCTKAQYNLLKAEYAGILSELCKRILNMAFSYQIAETQTSSVDEQLSNLDSDVVVK
jgi:DNA polymerase-3 subunit gamma/tau